MPFELSSAVLDREFPVRRNFVYFNHAAVAPLPRRVSDAIVAHNENVRDRGAADWRDWYVAIDATREKAAGFLGADRSEISFLPSTSWGLNLVAQSFDWDVGDNVVGDDMEFSANFYPWKFLEKRGVEYRLAKNRGGRVTFDDFAAKVDASTRIVAVSWVAFHNGWVYPIEEIGRFCREHGILFVVDAIQGLGALPLHVGKTPIDVLVADSHKWLLAAEACAVFYVAESAREKLPPPFGGWWNMKGEEGYLDYSGELFSGGRGYEPGSLPTAQIAGLAAALDLLTEAGLSTVRGRILAVVEALKRGLVERRWRIATPEPFSSGILAAIPPNADARDMAKQLEQRKIIVAPREGAVRFSPHFYNDEAQVARILQTIDEIA